MNRPANVNDLQVSWAIRDILPTILSFPERSLLWYFLSVIGNNDYCYDDFPGLKKKTGLSERCLRNYITKLESLKFIHVIRPERKGRGRTNQYFLLYSNIIETAKLSTNKATDAVLPELIGQQMPYLEPIIRQLVPKNKATDASYRYTIKKDIKAEREATASLSFDNSEKPKAKAVPMTDDFCPSRKILVKGMEMGLTKDEVDEEVEKFRAIHIGMDQKFPEKEWDGKILAWVMRGAAYKAQRVAKEPLKGSGGASGRVQQEVRSTVPWFNDNH